MAAYGVLPYPLSYEEFFGLELNIERTENRKTYFAALGHCIADSLDPVPMDVIRAVCDSEAQAKRLAQEINASRKAKELGF